MWLIKCFKLFVLLRVIYYEKNINNNKHFIFLPYSRVNTIKNCSVNIGYQSEQNKLKQLV